MQSLTVREPLLHNISNDHIHIYSRIINIIMIYIIILEYGYLPSEHGHVKIPSLLKIEFLSPQEIDQYSHVVVCYYVTRPAP